ncbi:hypothetical protein BGX31_004465 [Mortierella sp. GBA43]|nr:hypothetical protein BGX31_004465 [Mortierella sp. GBA43]
MGFRSTVPSHIGALSLQQALELSNIYLKNAYRTKDHGVSLVLCHDAEAALSQAKSANKKYHGHPNDAGYQALREGVAAAYIDLGKLMEVQGYQDEAQTIYKKAEKWGGNARDAGRLAKTINSDGIRPSLTKAPQLSESARTIDSLSSSSTMYLGQRRDIATIPSHIFAANLGPAITVFKLPDADERLSNTPQLVHCLSLLQASRSNKDMLELAVQKWLRAIENDTDEQERLRAMVIEVVRAFKRDEIKDAKAVAEVVYLAPVLDKDSFQDLLREFYSGIDHSGLLNFHQLEGLAQLIQGAEPGYLSPDDLVKILELLSTRLRETHRQSSHHIHQLTLAVSHVLDAMADTQVTGLDREKLHEPLSKYLSGLRESPDPFLVYQAAYAYQALLCVPDNETLWQAAMRRTGKVIQGISGMVTAVKSLDLVKFIEGLEDIQKGIDGASMVVEVFKTSYEGVASFVKNGQGFLVCLKEGLSFERKRDWYSALRGADELIRNGEFAVFRKLVCEAPCRYDPAFQWGVCQRLGEVAANTMWDPVTRASAVGFLGEIYRNDDMWGQEPSVKQWVLNILMQLDIASGSDIHRRLDCHALLFNDSSYRLQVFSNG